MSFFSSEYTCKLDAKGRLVLPAKIKSNLPESTGNLLMLRRGFEPCLVLYAMLEYKKMHSRISGLDEFDAEHRKLQRSLLRGNCQVELDSNGRFLIPKHLLAYASLEKEAIIVGVDNRIEIWNPEVYNNYLIEDEAEFSNLIQKHLVDKKS